MLPKQTSDLGNYVGTSSLHCYTCFLGANIRLGLRLYDMLFDDHTKFRPVINSQYFSLKSLSQKSDSKNAKHQTLIKCWYVS